MAPNSTTLPAVAQQIAQKLGSPDFLFLQEIQDNSGPTDDGTVIANVTMQTIADSVVSFGGAEYSFIEIAPVNDQDGGEPGGNIRQVILYVYSFGMNVGILRNILPASEPISSSWLAIPQPVDRLMQQLLLLMMTAT